jgi:hypothetical protein
MLYWYYKKTIIWSWKYYKWETYNGVQITSSPFMLQFSSSLNRCMTCGNKMNQRFRLKNQNISKHVYYFFSQHPCSTPPCQSSSSLLKQTNLSISLPPFISQSLCTKLRNLSKHIWLVRNLRWSIKSHSVCCIRCLYRVEVG